MRLVRLLRDALSERVFAARTDDGRRLELRELIVALASRRQAFRFTHRRALFGFSVGDGPATRLYLVRTAPRPPEARSLRLLVEAFLLTVAGMAGTFFFLVVSALARLAGVAD
jgi:hypothetical protein